MEPPWKASERENIPFSSLDVNPKYFCGIKFLGLMTLDEMMLDILRNRVSQMVGGNHTKFEI
jgi:hypothetical protein